MDILAGTFYVVGILGIAWIGLMSTVIAAIKVYSYYVAKEMTKSAMQGTPITLSELMALGKAQGAGGGAGVSGTSKSCDLGQAKGFGNYR
jgi:hypothetical protein